MAIAGLACVLAGVGLLAALMIGGALVRAAVALTNWLLGPVKREPVDSVDDWDWDAEPEDPLPRRAGGEPAVPAPGFPKAMMTASTIGVVNAFVGLVLGVFAEDALAADFDDGPAAVLLGLVTVPFGFAAGAVLFTVMLPTTFRRGAMVSFLLYALGLAIALVVGGAFFVLWYLSGG